MIKVFVASSNELKDERGELAVPVLGLNGWLYSRGVEERVALEKWEYLDSSMGVDHKQEEYNRALRACGQGRRVGRMYMEKRPWARTA